MPEKDNNLSAESENDAVNAERAEEEGAAADTSADASSARGIRWTYREIVRGKNWLTLIICMVIVGIIMTALVIGTGSAKEYGDPTAVTVADSLFDTKAQDLGQILGIVFVMSIPLLAVLFPAVSIVLKIIYSLRDRNLPRTPENLEAHEREAAPAWMWPLSIIIGAVDFTAAYAIFDVIIVVFFTQGTEVPTFLSTIIVMACLVLAERRIRHVSRGMAAYLPGNHLLIEEVARGDRDAELPESLRTPFGRAKVARVLSLGVISTLPWAVRLVKGIALRTRVKLFSGFLNSTIHGILTAFSFGIASTVANEVGAVSGAFAEGREEEYLAGISAKANARPSFKIEIICLIVCCAYLVFIAVYPGAGASA